MPSNGTVAFENPVWVDFARGMAPLMMPAAQAMPDIAGASSGAKWKVLDVAAGHGLFGIMMAAKNPNAEIVALDWPKVLEVAPNAQSLAWPALEELPGDAMAVESAPDTICPLPTSFTTSIRQRIDPEEGPRFARNRAAGPRLEFVRTKIVFHRVPVFSMIMLARSSGDAYTFAEFKGCSECRQTEIHELPGTRTGDRRY
jgi:hypothetical protein